MDEKILKIPASKALKSCPKSNKSPNLVTLLISQIKFESFTSMLYDNKFRLKIAYITAEES